MTSIRNDLIGLSQAKKEKRSRVTSGISVKSKMFSHMKNKRDQNKQMCCVIDLKTFLQKGTYKKIPRISQK